jgi:hypothetical protein
MGILQTQFLMLLDGDREEFAEIGKQLQKLDVFNNAFKSGLPFLVRQLGGL